MDENTNTASLRGVAERRMATVSLRPSRLKWFASGAAFGLLAAFAAFWVGVRLFPELTLAYRERPELRRVTSGMAYEQAVAVLGPEDGVVSGSELSSYDRHRSPGFPATMDFAGIEAAGGRFRFWLPRSEGLLVFNVVAFDKDDRVIGPWSGYATFFGKD